MELNELKKIAIRIRDEYFSTKDHNFYLNIFKTESQVYVFVGNYVSHRELLSETKFVNSYDSIEDLESEMSKFKEDDFMSFMSKNCKNSEIRYLFK